MTGSDKTTYILAATLFGSALYASSFYNYNLFHSIVELFSIVIAFSIFTIAWNTRRISPNAYLLFIGISFFFVACLDLLHLLGYKGMGVFAGNGANLATQLWIAARYLQSISLFAATFVINRKLRILPLGAIYVVATTFLLLSIFSGFFPDTFIEGKGLTSFKITSEYLISLILLAAIYSLKKKQSLFDRPEADLLIWSMIATIAAEMAFTLYTDVYGLLNLLGHLCKVISFYLIYAAIIKTNLKKPYETMVIEINDRKLAEQKLREAEEKYRTLAENSRDMIYRMSLPNGVYEYVSPASTDIFGYTPDDFYHTPVLIREAIHPDWREYFAKQWALLLTGDVPTHYEYQIIHKNGEVRWLNQRNVLVRDQRDNPVAIEGIVTDVTEKQRLEDQLRQSQKMEAIGKLAGGVAHDFNNILTVFITYGSMLKDKLKHDAVLMSYAERIVESTERAEDLTRGLLAFSRKQTLALKPIDLNDAVRTAVKLLHRLIGEDIDVKIALADRQLIVMADNSQIGQVLMNLATNARDAMPRGGLLSIQTEIMRLGDGDVKSGEVDAVGEYACISVSDNGTGMDKATRERIFEPFFTTKEVGKGTGLGLSIIYGIIKQHSGTIRVYSETGQGTRFKIYLPLLHTTITPSEETVPATQGGSETILFAEDSTDVRESVRVTLEEAGYRVIEAVDGEQAIKEFLKHQTDISLLLTDVIMPKKNGKEVYEAIRAVKPGIRVLFLSGYTADIITSKGLLDEGWQLMHKPASPDSLKRKIREILDRKQE